MYKTFELLESKLCFYNRSCSVIYNDDRFKQKIVYKLDTDKFEIVDSRFLDLSIKTRDYLILSKFDMKLVNMFHIEHLLSKCLSDLSIKERLFVKIISLIYRSKESKKIIVFNDVLTYLNDSDKSLIFNFLNKNNILFYNFTSDIDEVLYCKYLVVFSNNLVAIEGNTNSVLKEEKLLKRMGFCLPFTVELSTQLKAYNVIDNIYYSMDRLVDDLWNN